MLHPVTLSPQWVYMICDIWNCPGQLYLIIWKCYITRESYFVTNVYLGLIYQLLWQKVFIRFDTNLIVPLSMMVDQNSVFCYSKDDWSQQWIMEETCTSLAHWLMPGRRPTCFIFNLIFVIVSHYVLLRSCVSKSISLYSNAEFLCCLSHICYPID